MQTITRHYKPKDIEMLIAANVIIQNAIANKEMLQSKRSTWADPYFENLQTKINNTIETYIGKDAAKQMRQATQVVLQLQSKALTDLAEFKIQIVEDYKKDKVQQNEILTQLGFNQYHKPAQKGDQEALVSLLYTFNQSIEPLSADIIAKGTAKSLIDTIRTYADTLKEADITQETFKGTRKEITAESINAFNEIYDEVISIANIAKNFFKTDKNKKQQFTFNKMVANQNNYSVQPPDSNTADAPTS